MTHNRCLERERERKKNNVGAMILATFLINIFCLVFYVNIQPSCSKTRKGYFNIKLHYCLGKLSRDRLSGENCQRVSAEALFLQYFLFSSKLKATLKKRLFDQH